MVMFVEVVIFVLCKSVSPDTVFGQTTRRSRPHMIKEGHPLMACFLKGFGG